MNIEKRPARLDLRNDDAMAEAVRYSRIALCITDPKLPDNPIVFANQAFFDLSGYGENDVIGRNCRFLQGPETTPESVDAIRQAIAEQRVETLELVNYRADGSKFINSLQIGPILDDNGNLLFYFGSQIDVTAKRESEQQARALADEELLHRLRNIANVMAVIIRMTAREEKDSGTLATKISERLAALSDAHFATINRPADANQSVQDLARTVLRAYAPKGPDQFSLSGPDVPLPDQIISCLALCLHELAANAVKHGALSTADGRVSLDWQADERWISMRWQEQGGPKVVPPQSQNGSRIVSDLITAAGGTIQFQWHDTGLVVEIDFPR